MCRGIRQRKAEHVTLRTVALRHHNGPLHFVHRLEEALRAAGILFAGGRQTIFIQKSGDSVNIAGATPV